MNLPTSGTVAEGMPEGLDIRTRLERHVSDLRDLRRFINSLNETITGPEPEAVDPVQPHSPGILGLLQDSEELTMSLAREVEALGRHLKGVETL